LNINLIFSLALESTDHNLVEISPLI
jgi:hypothetical protein